MFKTVEDVHNYCDQHRIKMIDFKMIDLDGRWRHLTMPLSRFSEDTLKNGVGFDGSNYGYAPVEKSDMVFIPDLMTAIPEAFVEVGTLSMLGDVYVIGSELRRFEEYPRAIAAKAEDYMAALGVADESRTRV